MIDFLKYRLEYNLWILLLATLVKFSFGSAFDCYKIVRKFQLSTKILSDFFLNSIFKMNHILLQLNGIFSHINNDKETSAQVSHLC